MKVFNGRAATEDYLSTHSLTFSTPEMTLRKFALWLGEEIDSPTNKTQQIPRLIAYLQDINKRASLRDYVPDVSDSFEPSGAVTDLFQEFSSKKTDTMSQDDLERPPRESTLSAINEKRGLFCVDCGLRLEPISKFCPRCGARMS
jgi:hypothetical protein